MTRHDWRRSSYKWMDPTLFTPQRLAASCSPSPTSFHWEQYFFSQSPLAQGLYLTRSKSFPYYLLAIALSLFQTSSSGFVLLDQGARRSLYPLSSTCRCVLYIFWRPSKSYPLWCFTLCDTYLEALFHISLSSFFSLSLFFSNIYISLENKNIQYILEIN